MSGRDESWATTLVHPPACGDPHGSTSLPIYQTATFRQSAPGAAEYDYSRSGNPTRSALEARLADLEGGVWAGAFASGMAAIHALLGVLDAGDEVICGVDGYGGTDRLLRDAGQRGALEVRAVETADPLAIRRAISKRTRLVLVESPTDPALRICDLRAVASLSRAAGAWLAVDNTLLSPLGQQPLTLGADVVIHSATKILAGHADVTAGALVTRDPELATRLAFVQNGTGGALAPFEAWLLLRGLQTLALRFERQEASAREVARRLAEVPGLLEVRHPSLEAGPADAARRTHRDQACADGCVISVRTGDRSLSEAIIARLRRFATSVSFGSVASTVCLPCAMSHASVPADVRARRGFADDRIRFSIGIEDVEDLWSDLESALAPQARTRASARVPGTEVVGSG